MPDLRSRTSYYSHGDQARLFMREESIYGEFYNSTYSNFLVNEPLGLVEGSIISKDRNYIQPDVLTGSPSRIEGELGKSIVDGAYAFYLTHPYSKTGNYDQNTIVKLLKHAFSSDVTTGGSPSVSNLNQDLHTAGLGFLQLLPGKSTSTPNYSYASYFSGVRVDDTTISLSDSNSPVIISFSFLGRRGQFFDQDDSSGGSPEFSLPSNLSNWSLGSGTKPLPNYFPSWSTELTLSKNSTDYNLAFSNLSFRVQNNLIPISLMDGTNWVREFKRGQRLVTGSFTLPLFYASATQNTIQFIKDFFNKQNYSMSLKFNAEESSKYIEFSLPNVVLNSSPAPNNLNTGTVEFDVSFTAYPEKSTTEFKKNTEFSIKIN